MADIELLPLPEPVVVDAHIPTGVRIYAYDAATLGSYARANVEHHTAKLRVEIDALQDLCAAAYQMAGVHDAPVEWLDALSSAANGKPFSTDGLLPYMPKAVCDAEARAERLEEAFAGAAAQPEAVDEEMVERFCRRWYEITGRSLERAHVLGSLDYALAQNPAAVRQDTVTRESALDAIEHVTAHNGPGRDREAMAMLVSSQQGGRDDG